MSYLAPNNLEGDALAFAREEARLDALQYAADVAETIAVRGDTLTLTDGTTLFAISDPRVDEVEKAFGYAGVEDSGGRSALFYVTPPDAVRLPLETDFKDKHGLTWRVKLSRPQSATDVPIMTVLLATAGAL